jgi:6,7-dimethyl-8-ribityllumazine synthase
MPKRRSNPSSNGQIKTPAVAIVVSRYNASITDKLLEGARKAFAASGGGELAVIDAPGAFELPALSLAAARTGRFAGIVALGCLIKGETSHDRYIAEAVSQGLVNVTLATGVPVTFGVLTVDSPDQARARAGGEHGNKGADAMSAVLEVIGIVKQLSRGNTGSQVIRPAPRASRKVRMDKAARR